MKVDFHGRPKPLEFGEGETAFKLHLKPMDASDRMSIFDAAMQESMVLVELAIEHVVIGWESVLDSDGNPIPFEVEEKGGVKKNLARFLGCLPVVDHMRVIGGVLAFAGVPTGNVDNLVNTFSATPVDSAPTPPPDKRTTKDASGG